MNKRNMQVLLAALSILAAVVLQVLGLDVQLVATGAAALFSALAGYNTLNPNLDSLRETETNSLDVTERYHCGLENCCGDPDDCKQLGSLDNE